MKNILKKGLVLLTAAAAMIFASCGQTADDIEETSSVPYLTVNAGNARMVLPDAKDDLTEFDNFVLKGTPKDGTETELFKTDAIAKLKGEKISLSKIGEWSFTLSASKNGTIYSDTVSKTIALGENAVTFSLKNTAWGTEGDGSLTFTVTYKKGISDAPAVTLKKDGETTPVASDKFTVTSTDSETTTTTVVKADSIPAGVYKITFEFKKAEFALNTIKEYARVAGGFATTGTSDYGELNALHELTYELNGGAGAETTKFTVNSAKITLPTNVTKEGYDFAGWYINADFSGNAVTEIASGTDKDIKVYAKWTEKKIIKIGDTTYETIQAALNACTGTGSYTITLTKGTYNEVLYYNGAAKVLIKGLGTAPRGADVIISEANNGNLNKNNGQRSILYYQGSGSLSLENLTIVNTVKRSETTGTQTQAEVIQAKGSGNVAAYKCTFKSHQDTIQTVAKAWFYDCYVEGDVDFIWCEAGSKVALYEKCTLVAVGDETTNAYIAAPKMTATNEAFKGLVVLNSSVKADCTNTTLFRNPWGDGGHSTTTYNSVAYINTTFDETGKGTLSLALSGKEAFYNSSVAQKIIGWKLDETSNTNLKVNAPSEKLLSATDVATEFAGRNNIVNRYYDISAGCYKKDAVTNWNLKELAAGFGWVVDEDNSKDKLDGEKDIVTTTYDFKTTKTQTPGVTITGFVDHSSYGLQSKAVGDKIVIPVTGDCVISFYGYNGAGGTFDAKTSSGADVCLGIPAKVKTDSTPNSFIYKGEATNVELITSTSGSNMCISKIVVKTLDDEKVEVKSVTVTGATKVATTVPQQFTATVDVTYCGDASVTWTSSDETKATVDETGKVTGKAPGSVTIKATSKLDPTKFGEFATTIIEEELKPVAGTTYSYNFSKEMHIASGASEDTFVTVVGSSNSNSHGIQGGSVNFKVADGGVKITLGLCRYGSGTIKVSKGETVLHSVANKSTEDFAGNATATPNWGANSTSSFVYTGEATTLTITGFGYLEGLKIEPLVNATAITIAADSAEIAAEGSTTLSTTLTPTNANSTISWTITEGSDYAKLSSTTGTSVTLTGKNTTESAQTVKVKATSGSVESNEVTVTVGAKPAVTFDPANATVTWNFDTLVPASIASVNIQGSTNTGYVAGEVSGSSDYNIALYVDATVTNGKLQRNTNSTCGYAQFNTGTIIKIPANAGSVIKVVAYPGNYAWTVGGTAQSADENSYTVTAAMVSNGYVDMVATGNKYIRSITVTGLNVETAPKAPVTYTFGPYTASIPTYHNKKGFIGLDGTEPATAPSGNDLYKNLYADALAEINGSNAYVQGKIDIYGNAVLYVPVKETSKVSILYKCNSGCKLNIGGTEYESTTAVTVDIDCSSATLTDLNDIKYLAIKGVGADSTNTKSTITSISVTTAE